VNLPQYPQQQWPQPPPRPKKNTKAGALVILGMVGLFFLASAGTCTASALRPHEAAPTPTDLSAVMALPSGSWITTHGRPVHGTVYEPTLLGIRHSKVRMLQLEGSPLVVVTDREGADSDVDAELTGVITDTDGFTMNHVGEIDYRTETIDISKYCREKGVTCGSPRHTVLLVGNKPGSRMLTIAGAVALGLLALLTLALALSIAMSKPKPQPQ
jgi:hypothetical protein